MSMQFDDRGHSTGGAQPTGDPQERDSLDIDDQIILIGKANDNVVDREPSGAFRTYTLVKKIQKTPSRSETGYFVRIDMFALAADGFPSESVEVNVSSGAKYLRMTNRTSHKPR